MFKYIRNFVLLSAALGGGALLLAYYWLQHWYHTTLLVTPSIQTTELGDVNKPEAILEPYLIELKRGSHSRLLAQQLSQQGLLDKPLLAYWGARLFAPKKGLQAGVYALAENETLASLWQKIAAGEQHYFSITFAEGLNFQEWQQLIAQHSWLQQEWQDWSATKIIQQLAPDESYHLPEGLLFPDTYRFYAYSSDRQIYQQAYAKMQLVLNRLWQEKAADLPVKTPYEALILASIVEKETGAAHERGLVASVFINRLQKGMRLQSDPTIVYGLGERYRGVIYRSDINETTAYNTYRISGLPPTPIAMPGEAAIRATLQPTTSDYYYFVSQNNGTHIFSKTLQEHNRAVQQYQRNK